MTKLARLNERIEQLRNKLFRTVENTSDLDLDESYDLLRELREVSNERDAVALRDLEVASALEVLNRHKVAYKVWGEEDLRRRIHGLPGMAEPEIQKIIDHAMEGDDWVTMTEETYMDDQNVWAIIKGTAGDHPEWFSDAAREQL